MAGQWLNQLQWSCVVIQCCAIAIVQFDVTAGVPVLGSAAYALLLLTTCITAVSSVWNQLVIKGFDVPLSLMNTVLYSFGFLTSLACFFAGPARSDKGFFEGYNPLGVALISSQALHGLAVSFVYKHADAVVKNFANSSVMAVLVIVSAIWFGFPMNAHAALAVVIITVTTFVYMTLSQTGEQEPHRQGDLMAERLTDPAMVPSHKLGAASALDAKGGLCNDGMQSGGCGAADTGSGTDLEARRRAATSGTKRAL